MDLYAIIQFETSDRFAVRKYSVKAFLQFDKNVFNSVLMDIDLSCKLCIRSEIAFNDNN